MKRTYLLVFLSLWMVVLGTSASAQSGGVFEIRKSVIASGGGNSSGGSFVLDGTVGQSLAGVSSTGGPFQLTGGFWGGTAPAATDVTISGRVTSPSGISLGNLRVFLIDQLGVRRIATTSSFGIYTFNTVATGQTYTLTVSSKRFRFMPLIATINGSLTNLNFTGLE